MVIYRTALKSIKTMNFFKSLFGNKAENEEEKRREEERKNFETLKYDGVRALQINQIEQALRCFSHALQLHDDLETRDYYSQALIRNNDLSGAYAQLQKLVEAEPENLQIYLRMADVAYMMEDYVAMGNACEKAMLVDSENPQVLYRYAKACIGRDDLTNAIAMLTKAIMLNPKAYEAYLLRGETLLDSDDVDAADEDASHLLEHLADNEDVLILKARIEQKMGNKAEALTYYNKVIDVNPFSMVAFRERGPLRMELGDEQGGREDIEMAEEMAAQLAAEQAQGVADEDVEQKVKQAYKNVDAYGILGNS